MHCCSPYAFEGAASEANIQLRCRAHNQHEAREVFGPFVLRERAAEGYDVAKSGTSGWPVSGGYGASVGP